MLQPFTIADCVATNARSYPDRCAIEVLDPRLTGGVEPVETWTYGQLWGPEPRPSQMRWGQSS